MTVTAILAVLALAVAGAFQGDFSDNPDEAAHVVSSLAVRDYVAGGFPGNPVAYARQYYLHLPKIAIGHWPPLFYFGEAAWMLVFGRARIPIVLFSALTWVGLLASLYVWTRRVFDARIALVSVLLLSATPLLRKALLRVAPDALMAVLAFWAMVAWGQFLEKRRWRYGALAAALAAAAIGTHGRGVLLVPAFLIAFALEQRWHWTRTRIAVCLVCLVVLVRIPRLLGQANPFSFAAMGICLFRLAKGGVLQVGIPLLALAACGGRRIVRDSRLRPMLALLLGGVVLHLLVNVTFEARFLLPVALPVAACAAAGLDRLWPQVFARYWKAGAAVLTLLVVGGWLWPFLRKHDLGYHRLVASPVAGIDCRVHLVAGDSFHEGAFISEMALNRPNPDRFILRASKMMAASDWIDRKYRMLRTTPGQVAELLDRSQVGFVVLQGDLPLPHIALLEETLRSQPEMWAPVSASTAPNRVRMFRRVGPYPPGPLEIHIPGLPVKLDYHE